MSLTPFGHLIVGLQSDAAIEIAGFSVGVTTYLVGGGIDYFVEEPSRPFWGLFAAGVGGVMGSFFIGFGAGLFPPHLRALITLGMLVLSGNQIKRMII